MAPYGSFHGNSYVLRRIDTPRAWFNVLSNDHYMLTLSQLGSGYSAYKTYLGNQVTQNTFPNDDAGRFFYVRDAQSGAYWSPTVWPVETDTEQFDDWSCTYHPGSLAWEATRDGLQVTLEVTVAPDADIELYRLRVHNRREDTAQLEIFTYLEWAFANAPHELGSSIGCSFDAARNCLIANLEIPPQFRMHQTGFVSASEPILSYDLARRAFLGQPGSMSAPRAVQQGRCANHPHKRAIEQSCAAMQIQLTVPAGETREARVIVGVCASMAQLGDVHLRYRDAAAMDAQFAKVSAHYDALLGTHWLDAPAGHGVVDRANDWLKVQVEKTFQFTRSAGIRGYRDVMQDSAGMRLLDPARATERVLEALAHQRVDGYAPRQYPVQPWKPYDWRDYRDSPFWIIYGLEKVLKETGDVSLLHAPVPYVDAPRTESAFDHARHAVDFLWRERGAHGLCLLGHGDWLDSLNAAGRDGKGESIWLSMALCYALREMQQFAVLANRRELVTGFRQQYEELKGIINDVGWDGDWYLMAYNDLGEKIGSASCPDGGKIFINPQSWAVLSGVADGERLRRSVQACEDHLNSETGYLCFSPMYTNFDPHIGRITLWPSEGASVYSHASMFKAASDCLLGAGDRAWENLCRIIPAGSAVSSAITGAEPFAIPNAYCGPEWPVPNWSWMGWWTATADWALQTLIESVFGAQADYVGLRITPCLPSTWTHARVRRTFRGAVYDIHINKPTGLCTGEISVTVDGQSLSDNLIPPHADGKEHTVEVVVTPRVDSAYPRLRERINT
jgi:cellobiose phosphorylase